MKQFILQTLLMLLMFHGGVAAPAYGVSFKIGSYNVENLFDLQPDRAEYPEYRPGGLTGWDRAMLDIKLENIAAVINDLDAEIIALQEVESVKVLALLRDRLNRLGSDYPYAAIADARQTPVKCAVLSVFPIVEKTEIPVGHDNERNILKLFFDIKGKSLILYVNHWKSKSGPESMRLKYAAALAGDISKLACEADFILIGDFNSDYNEYETFKNISRLNDTRGITGINHVLHTVKDDRMVEESLMMNQKDCRYVYNLWLEIPEARRWSVNFFGHKNSPDSMIVSKGLYDAQGISYIDNSFDKFDPDYLFDNDKVFRWQRADRGKGRHLGKGYSDHLPIFAEFTIAPFAPLPQQASALSEPADLRIADLYDLKRGMVNVRIRNAVVIFKQGDNAVIKQIDGRAIYVYKAGGDLRYGMVYDLTVSFLNRFYGNLEITRIQDVKHVARTADLKACFVSGPGLDFASSHLLNEVIEQVQGKYENGWLHYDKGRKIRLYFSDPALKPENFKMVTLSHVRIGFHRHPEILVEKKGQVR